MARVTTYACNKCRPIDTKIIEAYEILTNTSSLVSQQETGRVTAEEARVAAESQRTIVFNQDHGTAVADHGIAAVDHATASADHTAAVADHETASADHTLAVQDHETSTVATTRANNAAAVAEHMADIHQGPPGPSGKAPIVGANEHWWTWDDETEAYVDSGEQAQGPVGATPDISVGTVTTGEPGTPASASMSGTAEAPILNLTIPKGDKGDQGNTGSSVEYPYELVNNRTTNDATKGLSAAEGYRLGQDLSQLEAEVHQLAGKFYGVFADDSDLPEGDAVGYAFVGTENPYAIWNFDGEEWSDSGSVANGITGEPGVGFSSIFTPDPYDGTVIIVLSNNDTITLDLNHNHPQYLKYVMLNSESEMPASPDSTTLYMWPATS